MGFFSSWSDVPGDFPKTEARRLGFVNPFPFAETYSSEPFPFPFDGEVLLVPAADGGSAVGRYKTVLIDDLLPVYSEDCRVYSGDHCLATLSSKTAALFVAEQVEFLRSAAAEQRRSMAEMLLERLWCFNAAHSRFQLWRTASWSVRVSGGFLAVAMLGFGPLAWGLSVSAPGILRGCVVGASAAAWGWTAIASWFLPRECLPHGTPAGAYRLVALVSPASAMRLYDNLGRHVLIGFEPSIVALVTGGADGPESVAASWLRDAINPSHRPLLDPDDIRGLAALAWFESHSATHAYKAVLAAGGDPQRLLASSTFPADCRSFCPRCLRQFTAVSTECRLCRKSAIPVRD